MSENYKLKNIGSYKKKLGHQIEKEFIKQFNFNELNNPIEYGAKADTSIDINHPIYITLKDKLNITGLNVSNKSGNNIQFTLGQIPELKDIDINDLDKNKVLLILNKYLKKINSDKPVDILVYKDINTNNWIFFNIDDIINFIVNNCIWRKLKTERIKGDFIDNSKKGYSQYITYEYRNTHKSYFLGLNGNKGKRFIELLMNNINYIIEPILL